VRSLQLVHLCDTQDSKTMAVDVAAVDELITEQQQGMGWRPDYGIALRNYTRHYLIGKCEMEC
jgi:hypothetical protein